MQSRLWRIVFGVMVAGISQVSTGSALAQVACSDIGRFQGKYIQGHRFGGGYVVLNADATFVSESESDDGTQQLGSGTFKCVDGHFEFLLNTKTIGRMFGPDRERKIDVLDPKGYEMYYGSRPNGEIPRDYKMIPVEWDDRIYLMFPGDDLMEFANAVNLGIEPRPELESVTPDLPYFGPFFLRQGDEKKADTKGLPNLPSPWSTYLLKKPIAARISSIDSVEKHSYNIEYTATIDKGSADGLKVGMSFLRVGERPVFWLGAEVTSVDFHTAKIKAAVFTKDELIIGTKLTSRFSP